MKRLVNDCHPQSPTFAAFASLRETLRDFVLCLAENGSRSRLLCRLTSLLKWVRQWERSLWK
jgi:hypothetical protein